jgi:hypothetical protein
MNYNVTFCEICQDLMTFQQLREGVYWLPNMIYIELQWACYEGFVHRFAHRACWKGLKEKRREQIREWSFKGQEPRSLGHLV